MIRFLVVGEIEKDMLVVSMIQFKVKCVWFSIPKTQTVTIVTHNDGPEWVARHNSSVCKLEEKQKQAELPRFFGKDLRRNIKRTDAT